MGGSSCDRSEEFEAVVCPSVGEPPVAAHFQITQLLSAGESAAAFSLSHTICSCVPVMLLMA